MTSQVAVNPSGRPGFRLKGRPEGQDIETDDDDEDEDGEDAAGSGGVPKSVAQRKLEEMAAAGVFRKQQQQQHRMNGNGDNGASSRRADFEQQQLRHQQMSQDNLTYPETTTMAYTDDFTPALPVPLPHPYNLPAPAPPQTPRTTRRQMMATELSESLRRNLLWERQLSKRMLGGYTSIRPNRSGGVLGDGLKPMTRTDGSAEQVNGTSRSGEEDRQKKRNLARNKSWAPDGYHAAGW